MWGSVWGTAKKLWSHVSQPTTPPPATPPSHSLPSFGDSAEMESLRSRMSSPLGVGTWSPRSASDWTRSCDEALSDQDDLDSEGFFDLESDEELDYGSAHVGASRSIPTTSIQGVGGSVSFSRPSSTTGAGGSVAVAGPSHIRGAGGSLPLDPSSNGGGMGSVPQTPLPSPVTPAPGAPAPDLALDPLPPVHLGLYNAYGAQVDMPDSKKKEYQKQLAEAFCQFEADFIQALETTHAGDPQYTAERVGGTSVDVIQRTVTYSLLDDTGAVIKRVTEDLAPYVQDPSSVLSVSFEALGKTLDQVLGRTGHTDYRSVEGMETRRQPALMPRTPLERSLGGRFPSLMGQRLFGPVATRVIEQYRAFLFTQNLSSAEVETKLRAALIRMREVGFVVHKLRVALEARQSQLAPLAANASDAEKEERKRLEEAISLEQEDLEKVDWLALMLGAAFTDAEGVRAAQDPQAAAEKQAVAMQQAVIALKEQKWQELDAQRRIEHPRRAQLAEKKKVDPNASLFNARNTARRIGNWAGKVFGLAAEPKEKKHPYAHSVGTLAFAALPPTVHRLSADRFLQGAGYLLEREGVEAGLIRLVTAEVPPDGTPLSSAILSGRLQRAFTVADPTNTSDLVEQTYREGVSGRLTNLDPQGTVVRNLLQPPPAEEFDSTVLGEVVEGIAGSIF